MYRFFIRTHPSVAAEITANREDIESLKSVTSDHENRLGSLERKLIEDKRRTVIMRLNAQVQADHPELFGGR